MLCFKEMFTFHVQIYRLSSFPYLTMRMSPSFLRGCAARGSVPASRNGCSRGRWVGCLHGERGKVQYLTKGTTRSPCGSVGCQYVVRSHILKIHPVLWSVWGLWWARRRPCAPVPPAARNQHPSCLGSSWKASLLPSCFFKFPDYFWIESKRNAPKTRRLTQHQQHEGDVSGTFLLSSTVCQQ